MLISCNSGNNNASSANNDNVLHSSLSTKTIHKVKVGILEVSPHLGTLNDNLIMLESYTLRN